MVKFLYIFACLSVVFNCATAVDLESVDGKIKITVGTTAGCSATVAFINNHLVETYETYREFLELEFVPWGRTTYNDDGTMECQFGSSDCFANRVHRCALDLLSGNQDAQMFYMTCEFTSPFPAYRNGSYLCAQSVSINLVDLDYCVSTTGHVLDLASQEAAREPMEIIDLIPTVHFNDVVDLPLRIQAVRRLKSMVCFALAEDESTGVTSCLI